MGANNSEIFEAQADEFYYMPHPTYGQVLVWDTRLEGRERDMSISEAARKRTLKTGADRGRLTPIHPAVITSGFAEYLATRRDLALFDGSPNVHGTDCNALVHNPDGGARIDKVFRSWRKSFTDPITRLSGRLIGSESLGKYLSGHRPAGILTKITISTKNLINFSYLLRRWGFPGQNTSKKPERTKLPTRRCP
jgi:hypothetical protein